MRPRSAPGAIRAGAKQAGSRARKKRQAEKRRHAQEVVSSLNSGFSVNPVHATLKALDMPRRGIWAAGSLGALGAANVLGDEKRADYARQSFGESLSGEYTGSDVLEDAGVQNKYVKALGGFGIDVASDPITYVGVGAALRGGSKVVSQRILKQAPERLATRYADEAGVSLADKLSGTDPRRGTARLRGSRHARCAQRW